MDIADFLALLDKQTRLRIVERSYLKDQTIFQRGDVPRFMFYIASGEARLVRRSRAGNEVIFQRARNGFLAEASLDQAAYHCDGIAIENMRAVAIPITIFRAALSQEKIRQLWLRHLSQELRRARAHGERLSLRSAKDRIIHFIETEGSDGRFAFFHSKKSWAAEMGLTHEALYRALAAMEKSGAAKITSGEIQLKRIRKP